MGHQHTRAIYAVLVGLLMVTPQLQAAAPTTASPDSAAVATALIHEIETMKAPELDPSRLNDLAYRESFNTQMQQFQQDRRVRINALSARFPHDPAVKQLMLDRWLQLARTGEADAVIHETAPILAAATDPGERLDLLYVRAEAQAWPPHLDPQAATQSVEEFLKAAPKVPRGCELLFFLAEVPPDPQKQAQIYRRAAADVYADSPYATIARGKAVQGDAIGKPFELDFQDLNTGKPVSLQKDLKGKIVAVIFWATWCAPCRAELPAEKHLYEACKDRGVEFISVSLDESETKGGLKALKAYLDQNPI